MTQNKKKLIVMKFGGSCLQDAKTFEKTANIIKDYQTKSKIVIVASAMKGVTDKLLEFYKKSCTEMVECTNILLDIDNIHRKLIEQIISSDHEEYMEVIDYLNQNLDELTQLGKVVQLIRPSPDIQDLIISYGEKLSTFILNHYLNSIDIRSVFLSSHELIITNDNFSKALPLLEESKLRIIEKLTPLLQNNSNEIICITGFFGSTKNDKKTTTLGRGGSDLTAAVLGYSLQSSFDCKVIYWKDVKGLLDADPKIAQKTSLIKNISYVEAKELAFFGTKVLHPLCLDVSEKGNVPSEIRYFNDPKAKDFTTITNQIVKNGNIIKAITSLYKLSMVTIESDTMVPLPGTASKLFSLLGDNKINIVFISQSSSENNITFGIDFEDSKKVSFLLRNSELFGKKWFSIKINNDISLVAVIGAGVLHTPGIAGKVFSTLGDNNINILAIAQGSSELNFTAIIERKNCERAINILYDIFIGQSNK
ncbi:MAG: aspartate kinase [Promethearchaeota archaeon]